MRTSYHWTKGNKRSKQPNVGLEPTASCSVGRRATIAPVRQTKDNKTLAGFEPAPPKGTDFKSVTLTTPSQRLIKRCKSAALPLELTPPGNGECGHRSRYLPKIFFLWRLGASIPLPVECESTALPLELNPPIKKQRAHRQNRTGDLNITSVALCH